MSRLSRTVYAKCEAAIKLRKSSQFFIRRVSYIIPNSQRLSRIPLVGERTLTMKIFTGLNVQGFGKM